MSELDPIDESEAGEDVGSSVPATMMMPLQSHPGLMEAIEIFIMNDRDLSFVEVFFKTKYGIRYPKVEVRNFFNALDPSLTKEDMQKRKARRELQERSMEIEKGGIKNFIAAQQMVWERMFNVYYSGKDIKTIDKSNVSDHAKQSKELCDLAKTFRELHQMRLEILGMGKTEEEAQEEMRNYVTGMLKEAIRVLDDEPSAQKKLSEFLDVVKSGPNEVEVEAEESS